jgi:hypothetical protein
MTQLQINMNQVIFAAFTVHTDASICGSIRRVFPPDPPHLLCYRNLLHQPFYQEPGPTGLTRHMTICGNQTPLRVNDSLFVLTYTLLTTARLFINTQ